MNGTFLEMKQLDLKTVALFYSDGTVKKLFEHSSKKLRLQPLQRERAFA